jgi:hypothetical protein
MKRIRRPLLRWGAVVLIAAGVIVGAVMFLQDQLQPCAPLDLALRRSGCVKVIELPQFLGPMYISAAPDGRHVAVTAVTDDDDQLTTVLVVDLETERIVEQHLISEIPIENADRPFGSGPRYAIYSPDGRLTMDYRRRKQITAVTSSDGERLISFIRRRPCYAIAIVESDTIVREIPISGSPPFLSQLALSYDDRRLAAARGRLVAWDLETGAPLIDLRPERAEWLFGFSDPGDFKDADWLPDNRTLVVALFGRPARIALFELPETAPAPDPSAAPPCQPETDEIRRWWVEGQ